MVLRWFSIWPRFRHWNYVSQAVGLSCMGQPTWRRIFASCHLVCCADVFVFWAWLKVEAWPEPSALFYVCCCGSFFYVRGPSPAPFENDCGRPPSPHRKPRPWGVWLAICGWVDEFVVASSTLLYGKFSCPYHVASSCRAYCRAFSFSVQVGQEVSCVFCV